MQRIARGGVAGFIVGVGVPSQPTWRLWVAQCCGDGAPTASFAARPPSKSPRTLPFSPLIEPDGTAYSQLKHVAAAFRKDTCCNTILRHLTLRGAQLHQRAAVPFASSQSGALSSTIHAWSRAATARAECDADEFQAFLLYRQSPEVKSEDCV